MKQNCSLIEKLIQEIKAKTGVGLSGMMRLLIQRIRSLEKSRVFLDSIFQDLKGSCYEYDFVESKATRKCIKL